VILFLCCDCLAMGGSLYWQFDFREARYRIGASFRRKSVRRSSGAIVELVGDSSPPVVKGGFPAKRFARVKHMTDWQDWLVPVGAIALQILWPCAEPDSNRALSKLTVERCQCNIPANRVLPCERSSQLDSVVTTKAVIPCQRFRTRHECLRYRNSREVWPLSRKSALSLPAAVIVKNTEAHSAR
jgi:hypothetical protein